MPNLLTTVTGARSQPGSSAGELSPVLRAVISNGDFGEYWRFHLAREQQRLHPGTAQGQYTLGAQPTLTRNELHPSQFGQNHSRPAAMTGVPAIRRVRLR